MVQEFEEKYKNGYIAAVLTDESSMRLKKIAKFEKIFCHHITIAYKPSKEIWDKYKYLINKYIKFDIVGIVSDNKCQVAVVKDFPTENIIPHITISCTINTPPKYSNQILSNSKIQNVKAELDSYIRFIPFKK